MSVFRRTPSLRVTAPVLYPEPWAEMPPRPMQRDWGEGRPDTIPKLYRSSGAVRREFDPCGAGPMSRASSDESGEST